MNQVKVWCAACKGSGLLALNKTTTEGEYCGFCRGNGYNPQPYTITDAQADAAVLSAINDYAATEIKKAILNRLHAFYVGGQDDKR